MHGRIDRYLLRLLYARLTEVPVVAILGPRQSGKSTLASMYAEGNSSFLRLDLERPADVRKLEDPEEFFAANSRNLICIDEIQRRPELFPAMRYWVDKSDRPGQFLILGSASRDLIRQSSESLAGRICYLELTPFLWREVQSNSELRAYLNRGGYPRSYLSRSDRQSFDWRLDFVRDFLERDVPSLNQRISPSTADRLLQMVAHTHGQILNINSLALSLGVDAKTVRRYLELLEGAFVLRRLLPIHANLKKRLIKSPKIYFRDTGLLHAVLGLPDWNGVAGHPVYGYSWESLCIENIVASLKPEVRYGFYRTSHGAEIDLLLETAGSKVAIEFKASSAPKTEKGFWISVEDLGIKRKWVIAPIEESYSSHGTRYASLSDFLESKENEDLLTTI